MKNEFSSINKEVLKNNRYEELTWKWIHDARIVGDFVENKITIKNNEVSFTPIIKIYREENRAILKIWKKELLHLQYRWSK
jgi:hypothetical protein